MLCIPSLSLQEMAQQLLLRRFLTCHLREASEGGVGSPHLQGTVGPNSTVPVTHSNTQLCLVDKDTTSVYTNSNIQDGPD